MTDPTFAIITPPPGFPSSNRRCPVCCRNGLPAPIFATALFAAKPTELPFSAEVLEWLIEEDYSF